MANTRLKPVSTKNQTRMPELFKMNPKVSRDTMMAWVENLVGVAAIIGILRLAKSIATPSLPPNKRSGENNKKNINPKKQLNPSTSFLP